MMIEPLIDTGEIQKALEEIGSLSSGIENATDMLLEVIKVLGLPIYPTPENVVDVDESILKIARMQVSVARQIIATFQAPINSANQDLDMISKSDGAIRLLCLQRLYRAQSSLFDAGCHLRKIEAEIRYIYRLRGLTWHEQLAKSEV